MFILGCLTLFTLSSFFHQQRVVEAETLAGRALVSNFHISRDIKVLPIGMTQVTWCCRRAVEALVMKFIFNWSEGITVSSNILSSKIQFKVTTSNRLPFIWDKGFPLCFAITPEWAAFITSTVIVIRMCCLTCQAILFLSDTNIVWKTFRWCVCAKEA